MFPGSTACSAPSRPTHALRDGIMRIQNNVVDGLPPPLPASGSGNKGGGLYPQSCEGSYISYFAPTSSMLQSEKPHPGSESSEFSGANLHANSSELQQAMALLPQAHSSTGYGPDASGLEDNSFDSTGAMPPVSASSGLSPPAATHVQSSLSSNGTGRAGGPSGVVPATCHHEHGPTKPPTDASAQDLEVERDCEHFAEARIPQRRRELKAARRSLGILMEQVEKVKVLRAAHAAAAAEQQVPQHAANDEESASVQLTQNPHHVSGAPLDALEEEHAYTHTTYTTVSQSQVDLPTKERQSRRHK